ncbi:MAG TPA: lipopolysaccharide transport periplasmic protein LptA, partial [Steroidobacteraceae bacterium]
MAPTYPRSTLLAALLVGASAAAAAQAPPAKPGAPASTPAAPVRSPVQLLDKDQPIHMDAANTEVDYKTKRMIYHDIVISQGTTRVQADTAQATGLNFENSKWTFEGNVRINAEPRGNLRSDSAVVEFKDNLITRATVIGKPAEFEQKREDSDQIARGHADKIVYDVTEATVRLSDDAWLSDGQSEISGPLLVYNIRAQRVQASGTPGAPVQAS